MSHIHHDTHAPPYDILHGASMLFIEMRLNHSYLLMTTIKRCIVLGLFAAVVAIGMPSAAYADSTTSESTVIGCVKPAIATREAALAAGWSTYADAKSAAYTARASALATAYTNAMFNTVKDDVKIAWATFRNTTKSARSTWSRTRGAAWKTFRAAAKTCRATSAVNDSGNASADNGL